MELLIGLIFIAVLATFAGAELIGKIPPQLHTPLMSGSNAISGTHCEPKTVPIASPERHPHRTPNGTHSEPKTAPTTNPKRHT